jgi:hypothetical protein
MAKKGNIKVLRNKEQKDKNRKDNKQVILLFLNREKELDKNSRRV